MDFANILKINDKIKRKHFLREYYETNLRTQHYNTGRKSIITEQEYKDFVELCLDFNWQYQTFPIEFDRYSGVPMMRSITKYSLYVAKIHGFETDEEFTKFKNENDENFLLSN